jgi:hypothetical protein
MKPPVDRQAALVATLALAFVVSVCLTIYVTHVEHFPTLALAAWLPALLRDRPRGKVTMRRPGPNTSEKRTPPQWRQPQGRGCCLSAGAS